MNMVDLGLGLGGFLFVVIVWRLIDGPHRGKKESQRLGRVTRKPGSASRSDADALTLRRANDATVFGRQASSVSLLGRIKGRLDNAGIALPLERYLIVVIALTLIPVLAMLLWHKPLTLSILVGIAVGVGIPHVYVGRRIKKRQKQFLKLFPDAIDLIVRGLRAGLPVAKSMQTVATEIGEPVAQVFRESVHQVALGVNLEQALLTMASRLKMTEFSFFATSIILQRETGGNLAEILANLSEVLRSRHMMQMKIKAMSSEARASAAIVGALPFIVFGALNVLSPEFIGLLYHDFRGNLAIVVALGMLSFGVFVMNRMAKFEI